VPSEKKKNILTMKVINTEIYNVLYLLHEETIKITRSARGMNLIRDNEIVNNLT
jgi:hypothetical protein